jgi:hypothetical protein
LIDSVANATKIHLIAGSGTLTAINNALATLSYRGVADTFDPDTVNITVNDQGNTGSGGPQSANASIAITPLFTDNFQRADAPNLGPNWQIPPLAPALRFHYRRPLDFGGFALQNNAAVSTGPAPFVAAQVAGLSLLNPTLKADVNATNSQALVVGLAARIQSNNDAYVAALTHDGTAEILLFNGASNKFTVLDSISTIPAGTNVATLQFTVTGGATPTLTLSLIGNSTPLLTVMPTGLNIISSPGGAGLFAWGPNGMVTNFSVTGS